MDQLDLSAWLGDVLAEGQEPVLDIAMGSDAMYAVTAFTTVKISSQILVNPPTSAQAFFGSDYLAFAPSLGAAVLSVALGPDGDVYLGTAAGLWSEAGSSDPAEFFDADPQPVPGAEGHVVGDIAVSSSGHVAFISWRGEGSDSLVVLADGVATAYRTIQGLPGQTLTALAWLDADTLLVAGEDGLAALDL
jgi:hypothetical protein